MMPAAEISPTSMMQKGQFFICPCGVYGVFVRAVTVFLLCRCSLTSTLQKPCTCFALFSGSGTLHCYRGKNSASAFPPQLPLLHICDPAGVGITAMWISRIADRYNAPSSVSRVRAGFRDDCVGWVCGKELPQCCLPLRP